MLFRHLLPLPERSQNTERESGEREGETLWACFIHTWRRTEGGSEGGREGEKERGRTEMEEGAENGLSV